MRYITPARRLRDQADRAMPVLSRLRYSADQENVVVRAEPVTRYVGAGVPPPNVTGFG